MSKRFNQRTSGNANVSAGRRAKGRKLKGRDPLKSAVLPLFEGLEKRQLLTAVTTFVDDHWVVTTDVGAPGLSAGDTVANNDDIGTPNFVAYTGKTYGTDAFSTIQDGIDGTTAGGTINVSAGTYSAPAAVNKAVTILGQQRNVDARFRSLASGESIVDSNTGGFDVSVSNVTINGFVIQNVSGGTGTGVNVQVTAGNYTISNNIIKNNITGLTLASGANGVVSQNQFDGNTLAGTNSGTDIVSNGASNLMVSSNAFTESASAVAVANTIGVNLMGGSATLTGNAVDKHAVGVQMSANATATLLATNFDLTVDNTTDIKLLATSGGLTLSSANPNSFGGDTFFIDNQSANTINAVGSNFDVSGNFRIEDKMHHKVDTDDTAAGVVYWVLNNIYVTAPGVGSTDSSINQGIAAAAAGLDTVNVEAGTYQENVTVNKSVVLKGANAGVAGAGVRGAETIVLNNAASGANSLFNITANDVTIDGFKLDGYDTTAAAAALADGESSNVSYGFRAAAPQSGLNIKNNIVNRVFIGFRGDASAATAAGGNVIDSNWFDGIGNYDFGYAVSLRTNFYADVTHNKMTRVWTGVHLNDHHIANPAGAWNISNNDIHSYAGGLLYWLNYDLATAATFDSNTITAEAGATPGNYGILVVTLQGIVTPTFTNNSVTGTAYGIGVFNAPTSGQVTFGATNSVTGTTTAGVQLTDNLAANPIGLTNFLAGGPGAASTVNITGMTVSAASGNGVIVEGDTNLQTLNLSGATLSNTGTGSEGVDIAGGHALAALTNTTINSFHTGILDNNSALSVGAGNSINTATDGIDINGASASVIGNTFNNLVLTGITGNYVDLEATALHGQTIDASGVSFNGVVGGSATPAQAGAIENKIHDRLDDATLGLISLQTNVINVISIGASGPGVTPTATDNDYTRINNAIQGATSGQTINLIGTFDWTETNAAASWALGSDGQSGGAFDDDNYEILAPGGLNGVTLTAPGGLGSATILGPGDLPTVNLEAFLVFEGVNTGWTISDLDIEQFDLSLAFFASGVHDFDNTTVTGNKIVLAADVDNLVDTNQNIGIHFSFGTNQTISNNQIIIPGNGFSSVGMQSNTSGGAVYDGLLIAGNTVQVDLAGAAPTASRIIGIWENGHAHSSNITVSGNTFENINAGLNNVTTNNETAFRITSQGSATSSVHYTGNMVDGANVGFQWLADTYAGTNPVQFSTNTLCNSGTGILVNNGGFADFHGDHLFGNRIGIDLADSGPVTLNGVDFTGGPSNGTDLRIGAGAGTVADILNTQFAGDTFYIDNQSAQSLDISGKGNTFDEASNYRIEDKMHHAVDTDDTGAGLITWVANTVFVTDPATNSPSTDSSIQAAIDAAPVGYTVMIENGTYTESDIHIDHGLTIQGQSRAGVHITPAINDDHSVLGSIFDGHNAFILQAGGITIRDLSIDGGVGVEGYRGAVITDYNQPGIFNNFVITNISVSNVYDIGIDLDGANGLGTGFEISHNSVTGVGAGPHGYAIIDFNGSGAIFDNTVLNSPQGISTNFFPDPAFAPLLSIHDNDITGTSVGMNLSGLAGGSSVADNNVDNTGVADSVGIVLQYTTGPVTLSGNSVTADGNGAGIWLYKDTGTVTLDGNDVESSSSTSVNPGEGTGILITDNGDLFGEFGQSSPVDALLIGNSVSGFNIGLDLYQGGTGPGANVTATVGGSVDDGNTFIDNKTGVRSHGSRASVDLSFDEFLQTVANAGSVGVDIDGGTATVNNNRISGNDIGVRVDAGGTLTGATQNFVVNSHTSAFDLSITAGPVGPIRGNDLSGNVIAINNGSATTVDASLNYFGVTSKAAVGALNVGLVDFSPWINNGTDVDGDGFDGYQADLSSLSVGNNGAQTSGLIQEGIGYVNAGGVVIVTDGTYSENVNVNKSVHLQGANSGVNGSAARGTETIVQPGTLGGAIFTINANNVAIDGFTIDGYNAALPAFPLYSGDSSNVSYAIFSGTPHSGLTVTDNIVKRVFIGVRGTGDFGATPTSLNSITDNWFDSIGNYDFGYAVSLQHDFYANVIGNKMTRVWTGIHTSENEHASPDGAWSLSNNTISSYAAGILYWGQYGTATSALINHNTITAEAATMTSPAVPNSVGLELFFVQNGVNPTITNNTITGYDYGLIASGTSSPGGVTLDATNSITGSGAAGVYVTDHLGFNAVGTTSLNNGGASTVNLTGLAISSNGDGVVVTGTDGLQTVNMEGFTITNTGGSTTGVRVAGDAAVSLTGVHVTDFDTAVSIDNAALTLGAGNIFEGGGTGLKITGIGSSIAGDTLSNTAFNAQTGLYIDLEDNALQGHVIDASAASFDGAVGATATPAQIISIEAKIHDRNDDPSLGLISLQSNVINVISTGAAGDTPTDMDNDYTRINNAIQGATSGQTINLIGTFNWGEHFAMASWAAGSDATAGTEDDYSINPHAGLNDITLTAAGGLGTATIVGPGELSGADASFDLEGFLAFLEEANTGWTISNLQINNFDLGIGMFYDGRGSTDGYHGTTITNNTITLAKDGADSLQNIGIHYAFGKDQTISNNHIIIPGDGISSVGMQSNTSGGDVYDGLHITGNIIDVDLAGGVPTATRILGIWENGHAHSSNITVSGNTFENINVGMNNINANNETAFRVTSHSAADNSSTVTYSNNTVSGAQFGFWWYSPTDFSGNGPVVLDGNHLTNVGTGVLVQSNGSATLTNNTFTGGTTGVSVAAGSSATLNDSVAGNHISGFATGVLANGAVALTGANVVDSNGLGVDVNGGVATINGGQVNNSGTGIRLTNGGTASIQNVEFDGGGANNTDLRIDSDAGTPAVTALTGNHFSGGTLYIDNQSAQDINATGNTFNVGNNFEVEDRIFHKVDDLSKGLVTWVAGNIFVTDPTRPNPDASPSTDSSIQRGVDAAPVGFTVNVEAGLYNELVTIDHTITLKGANAGVDGAAARGAESVISNANGDIKVRADGIAIDGFKLTGVTSADPGSQNDAVDTSSANSGLTFQNNIVTGNVFGLYLNSNGLAHDLVAHNLFDTNTNVGPASGDGIYSDQGLSNATIDHNTFTGNTNSMVLISGHDIDITFNTMTNDGSIALLAITDTLVDANTSTGSISDALYIGGGDSGIEVSRNTFTGAAYAAIEIEDFYAVGVNSDVNIHNNFLDNNQYGLVVDHDSYTGSLLINNNHITGNAVAGLANLLNPGDASINAEANYWGSATGPTNPANPSGTGDVVTGPDIDFTPWLTSGVDTDLVQPGFQPNAVDMTPPIVTAPDLDDASDTHGATIGSMTDDRTADSTPSFSGTTEANSTVELFMDGNPVGSTMSDGMGVWHITVSTTVTEGSHSFTIQATDQAGNVSVVSDPLVVVFDYTAPTATVGPVATPSSSAVDSITITFSEEVEDFDLSDITLNGNPLTGNEMLSDSGDHIHYTLSGLSHDDRVNGAYTLTVVAAGSSINDNVGIDMTADASNSWTVLGDATVTGRAFQDFNANGLQDGGETGLTGVTVHLIDPGFDNIVGTGDDIELGSTLTGAGGAYTFSNITAGPAFVKFDTPTNFTPTLQDVGSDDTIDSDIDATGNTGIFNIPAASSTPNHDAGYIPSTTITSAPGVNDNYYVRLDPTHQFIQVFAGTTPAGSPAYTYNYATTPSLTFNTLDGDDHLFVDFANGTPVPTGGIAYNGGTNTGVGDALSVYGNGSSIGTYAPSGATTGSGTISVGSSIITMTGVEPVDAKQFASLTLQTANSDDVINITSPTSSSNKIAGSSSGVAFSPITISSTASFILDLATNDTVGGGSGDDTVNVNIDILSPIATQASGFQLLGGIGNDLLHVTGGTIALNTDASLTTQNLTLQVDHAGAVVNLNDDQHLASLDVENGGLVTLHTGQLLLATSGLTVNNGRLDLNDGFMILHNHPGQIGSVLTQIGNTEHTPNPGTWLGNGIGSSYANTQLNSGNNVALGAALNDDGAGNPTRATFAGEPVDATDILVRYTYFGDNSLDGKVDAEDVSDFINGFNNFPTAGTWERGDYNYDGVINADDTSLLIAGMNSYQANGALAAPALAAVPLFSTAPIANDAPAASAAADSASSDPTAPATAQMAGASSSISEKKADDDDSSIFDEAI